LVLVPGTFRRMALGSVSHADTSGHAGAGPRIGRYAPRTTSSNPSPNQPREEDRPVKKLLLLLVVVALGAVIAKKVRTA
jgi:hypothetical protein